MALRAIHTALHLAQLRAQRRLEVRELLARGDGGELLVLQELAQRHDIVRPEHATEERTAHLVDGNALRLSPPLNAQAAWSVGMRSGCRRL